MPWKNSNQRLKILDKEVATKGQLISNSILLRSGLYPAWLFGCQQDFLVVWRWNQLRTFQGIFENNFIDFREAVSLEKIFEIVQENTLKFSKLISFLGNKKSSLNQCQAWSCYYATGCFVEFLGNFFSSTSSLGPPLFRHSSA